MSTGLSFTLEHDGQKSGGVIPPVWKVEEPLTPWPPWLLPLVPSPANMGLQPVKWNFKGSVEFLKVTVHIIFAIF